MNRKVTLPELVEALMGVTNTTKRVSETFLRELFSLISEQLISGDSVKVKGLGVFKVVSVDARKSIDVNTGEEIVIAAHNKVAFTADKELAEAINMPFASFETVVLSDDIPEEELKIIEADSDIEVENEIGDVNSVVVANSEPELIEELVPQEVAEDVAVPEIVEPEIDVVADEETMADSEVVEHEILETQEVIEAEDSTNTNGVIYTDALMKMVEDNVINNYLEEVKGGKRRFISGYLWGFISAAIVAAMLFIVISFDINITPKAEVVDAGVNMTAEVVEPVAVKVDSIVEGDVIEEVVNFGESKVVAKEEIVYDTITSTRFIATIAREHYGNMNFWVYIYEENKSKIANPNVLAPGTVLVVPNADKYGIDANDPESVRVAVIKSRAVAARFN